MDEVYFHVFMKRLGFRRGEVEQLEEYMKHAEGDIAADLPRLRIAVYTKALDSYTYPGLMAWLSPNIER